MPEVLRGDLIAKLCFELRERWRAGDRVRVEALLQAHPELAADAEGVLDLIYTEVVVREEMGEEARLEEYLERFPHYEAPLRRQFELHLALDRESLLRWAGPESAPPPLVSADTPAAFDHEAETVPPPAPSATDELQETRLPGQIVADAAGATPPAQTDPQETFTWGGEAAAVSPPPEDDQRETRHYKVEPYKAVAGPDVPGYEIRGVLGRGGMGVVYQAWHLGLKRMVALKMILSGANAGEQELLRFRLEAEAVARLQHPNIVQIYEIGAHDGRPFFSLEFVDGGSLAGLLKNRVHPPEEVAQAVETLARGMHAAHQHDIIHRDLKPANVLLKRFRRRNETREKEAEEKPVASLPLSAFEPKITDFGLAKKLDEDSGQTHSGQIMGTPSYMSPEQAEGKIKEIGPATDIYALGAILYEMLAGRPPFKAETPFDTVVLVVSQEPLPPSRLRPKVPRDLEIICLKCLQKEIPKRYASAEALADDLKRYRTGEPILARPVTALERTIKWIKRRPTTAGLIAATSLAVLVTAVAVPAYFYQRAEHAAKAREHRQEIDQAHVDVPEKLHAGEQARDRGDWQTANDVAIEVQGIIERDPSLTAEYQERTEALRGQADAGLKAVKSKGQAAGDFKQFGKYRDAALLYTTRLTDFGASAEADLKKSAESARLALALFLLLPDDKGQTVPVFRPHFFQLKAEEQLEIKADCYELLFVLAQSEAQPRPGWKEEEQRAGLERAVRTLQHLSVLKMPAPAGQQRLAEYLTRLQRNREAAAARAQAEAGKAQLAAVGPGQEPSLPDAAKQALALDYFLRGLDGYQQSFARKEPEILASAIADFEQATRLQTNRFWPLFYLAVAYLRTNKPSEAASSLSSCLSLLPDNPQEGRLPRIWCHLFRGLAHGLLAQANDPAGAHLKAALADYQRALDLRPDETALFGIHNQRGMLWVQHKNHAEAVKDLNEALRLRPNSYEGHMNLALAYVGQKKSPQAVEELERAIQLQPRRPDAYRTRALLQRELGDKESALADLDQVIHLEAPGSPRLAGDHYERGQFLLQSRKLDQALDAFDKSLELKSKFADAHLGRAETLLLLAARDQAAGKKADLIEVEKAYSDYFDNYKKKEKPRPEVYRARASVREKLGQYPGAVEDYTKALELLPDAATYAKRGWIYLMALDGPKQAARDFDEALKLKPGVGDWHNGRGYARVKTGQFRGGVADAEEAVRLGPKSTRIYFHAARTAAQAVAKLDADFPQPNQSIFETRLRYQDLSVKWLRQALELLPKDQQASFWRETVQTDGALFPIRKSPGFAKLAVEFAGSEKKGETPRK